MHTHKLLSSYSFAHTRFIRDANKTGALAQSRSALPFHRTSRSSSTSSRSSPHFQACVTGSFTQSPPKLSNQYQSDWFLQSILKSTLPAEVFNEIDPELCRFGEKVATSIYDLHLQCGSEPPFLRQFDAWGNRIDEIVTSPAWKQQKSIAAEEGIIAIPYLRKHSEYSRLHQAAKVYLYSPSSGLYGCPLAMTDGAARTIEALGLREHLRSTYDHLTSTDPATFWTSGQWMTEKRGGSDVANGTETVAYPQEDGSYALHGLKWFSSATDSDMALTLARIVSHDGTVVPGSKGLSMFYLEVRSHNGRLNNIQIIKLKDKLGTRQLPTAELLLTGTKARLLGETGRGVASISSMLTVSRLWNSMFACSSMNRMVSICTDYSKKREAFGQSICRMPLHMRTLASMKLETMGATVLTFEVCRLLGLEENGKSTDEDRLLIRLLTPIAKLYTAKQAMYVMSEGLECIGGQGYIEDTGLPSMLRDAQVLPIWEGTTNVLSLDILRAIQKTDGDVIKAFFLRCLADSNDQLELRWAVEKLQAYLTYTRLSAMDSKLLSFSLARVSIGCLLNRLASQNCDDQRLQIATQRWCMKDLVPVCRERNNDKLAKEDWSLLIS